MTAIITPNDDLLISAYLDDELDAHTREKLETRLEHDAALRERLEIMALQADELEAGPSDEVVPAQLQNRINAILDAGFGVNSTSDAGPNDAFITGEKFVFPKSTPTDGEKSYQQRHELALRNYLNNREQAQKAAADTTNNDMMADNAAENTASVSASTASGPSSSRALVRQGETGLSPINDITGDDDGKQAISTVKGSNDGAGHYRNPPPVLARWWAGAGVAAALALAFCAGGWYEHNNLQIEPVIAANGTDTKVDNAGLDMLINETLETTQSGQIKHAALATNSEKIGKTSIEPLRTFQLQGRFCREYRADIDLGQEKPITFFGRACRDPKEGWQTVYRLFPGSAIDLGPEPLAAHQNL